MDSKINCINFVVMSETFKYKLGIDDFRLVDYLRNYISRSLTQFIIGQRVRVSYSITQSNSILRRYFLRPASGRVAGYNFSKGNLNIIIKVSSPFTDMTPQLWYPFIACYITVANLSLFAIWLK